MVRLIKFENVKGVAVAAGDIAGPSVRVTVDIRNDSATNMDLSYVVVNAYTGSSRVPVNTLVQPGGAPFTGVLPPGRSATGVYLFQIPTSLRSDVTIVVDYFAGQAAAVFRGAV